MNVRHPMGVLHSFSIKNVSTIKRIKAFLFSCDKLFNNAKSAEPANFYSALYQ